MNRKILVVEDESDVAGSEPINRAGCAGRIRRKGWMKMLPQTRITRYVGFAISGVGLAVIALGVFFVTEGIAAKSEVQAALAEEQVTVTIDGVTVPVTNQATAMAMADVIKGHTLGAWGPWQSMEGDDSDRATMLEGLALRNSLTLARMALDLSELVAGLGAVLAVVGVGFTATGAVIAGLGGRAAKEESTAADRPIEFRPGYDQAA